MFPCAIVDKTPLRHMGSALPSFAGRTVFLDRDGIINRLRENDYVKSWSEFEFLPDAKAALRRLSNAGYRVIVVTNQRGVARGYLTETDLEAIHRRMVGEAEEAGGRIAAVYYCPHEIGECECRKPKIGLFLEAQRDFDDIDFSTSTVIGDSASDMEAGLRLGCTVIFVGKSDQYLCAGTLYQAVARFLLTDVDNPTP